LRYNIVFVLGGAIVVVLPKKVFSGRWSETLRYQQQTLSMFVVGVVEFVLIEARDASVRLPYFLPW
jgi:hypothetical protein